MSFKLVDLPYQRQAIEAVVRLFDGQLRNYFDLELQGDSTIKRLLELAETEDKPFFICLERALSTTTKWNLKHFLGNHFNAF